jgi:hypothetical protein
MRSTPSGSNSGFPHFYFSRREVFEFASKSVMGLFPIADSLVPYVLSRNTPITDLMLPASQCRTSVHDKSHFQQGDTSIWRARYRIERCIDEQIE